MPLKGPGQHRFDAVHRILPQDGFEADVGIVPRDAARCAGAGSRRRRRKALADRGTCPVRWVPTGWPGGQRRRRWPGWAAARRLAAAAAPASRSQRPSAHPCPPVPAAGVGRGSRREGRLGAAGARDFHRPTSFRRWRWWSGFTARAAAHPRRFGRGRCPGLGCRPPRAGQRPARRRRGSSIHIKHTHQAYILLAVGTSTSWLWTGCAGQSGSLVHCS